MTGHIRKRDTKKGIVWQVILDKGEDAEGKRLRDYYTLPSKKEAQAFLAEKLSESHKGAYIEPSQMTVKECVEEWLRV